MMQAYLNNLKILEDAAIAAGLNTTQSITAFRKLYYNNATAARNYAGSTFGGGTWNILIPNANTQPPQSWSSAHAQTQARQHLLTHKEATIGGKPVDMGHVFCGLDAGNHPSQVSLAHLITMKSNKEAVTFVGDLGSVVVEYLYGATGSFYDVARTKNLHALTRFYDGSKGFISAADMAGNADAYAININNGETLHSALSRYYLQSGYTSRYSTFRHAINAHQTGAHQYLVNEVMNAALAYAASKPKYRADVINVTSDPGMGIKFKVFGFDLGTPTSWEAYYNISGWVVELFLQRIASQPF